MITADGCRARRAQLLEKMAPAGPLAFADPVNLRYLAGFSVDPFSLGADFGGLLVLHPGGETTLFFDHRLPKAVEDAHADEKVPLPWYDGVSPGQGPRRMVLRAALDSAGTDGRIHDSLADPYAPLLEGLIAELRRVKDDDELATLHACCRAAEAGHAWSLEPGSILPGMTELDVYNGVFAACSRTAGRPAIVYGDFAVSPGSKRRGGPPTGHVIQPGETLILDFSVVLLGYRCDFTNTLVVGAEPTAEQTRLFDLCVTAMAEGEKHLRAGVKGREVYGAVRDVFQAAGVENAFPHHAGHGIGLGHPEAPFLVKQSLEELVAGDVVTLEPGLYIDGVGGVRIEHNYLVTESGFERVSNHRLTLQ